MKIEIWSDIACPWCYIGKRRFERALGSFSHRDEVEIIWRSFELDPAAPLRHTEKQAHLLAQKYGVSLEQAEAMNANMTAEATKEGLDFRFDLVQVGNTFDAHRLMHFAASDGKHAEMVERLFKAYLTDGEAVGELDVLMRLAEEVGLDAGAARRVLASNAYANDVRADEERARMFGISGVPFFAIDEKYGVSGAQPPEAILDVLRQAWNEFAALPAETSASLDGCNDGICRAVTSRLT